MIRWGQNNIIFLINNGGYTIEVEIHDGPYNVIKNWNYTGVVEAFHNGEGKCYTAKVGDAVVGCISTVKIRMYKYHFAMTFHNFLPVGPNGGGTEGGD